MYKALIQQLDSPLKIYPMEIIKVQWKDLITENVLKHSEVLKNKLSNSWMLIKQILLHLYEETSYSL